jgi:hypothetical protein
MKRSSDSTTATAPATKQQAISPIFEGFEIVPSDVISNHIFMFLDIKTILSFLRTDKSNRAELLKNELFHRLVQRDIKFIKPRKYVESKNWLLFYKNLRVTLTHEYKVDTICKYPEAIDSLLPIGNRSFFAITKTDGKSSCVVSGVFDWNKKKFNIARMNIPKEFDYVINPIKTRDKEFVMVSSRDADYRICFYESSIVKDQDNNPFLATKVIHRTGLELGVPIEKKQLSGFAFKGDFVIDIETANTKGKVLALIRNLRNIEDIVQEHVKNNRTQLDFSEVYKDVEMKCVKTIYNESSNNIIIVIEFNGCAYFDIFICNADDLFKDNKIKPKDRTMFKRFNLENKLSKPRIQSYMSGFLFTVYDLCDEMCVFPIKIYDKNFKLLTQIDAYKKLVVINGKETMIELLFRDVIHNRDGDLIIDCGSSVRIVKKPFQQNYKDFEFRISSYGKELIELAEDPEKQEGFEEEFNVDTLIDAEIMPDTTKNTICLNSGLVVVLGPYDGYVYQ